MDVYPVDGLTQGQIEGSAEGAEYATSGNYSMLKDVLEFQGSVYSANSYIRHFMQMSEFPGDNTTLSGRTSDPLYEASCYKHNPTLSNVAYLWFIAYKMLYGVNVVIDAVPDGASIDQDQLKGENYFLRAMVNFDLSRFFSRPYAQGRENKGIVLRLSSKITETARSTVGEVYDAMVSDLENAARLMTKERGNGYASRAAAYGLLSRVHLYMGANDKAIAAADEALKLRGIGNLEPTANFPSYFSRTLESSETLFAIGHTTIDSRGQSSIGSMYLNDGTGWGEVYASFPYLELLGILPHDVRHQFIMPQYLDKNPNTRGKAIYYEVYNAMTDTYDEASIDVTYNVTTAKYEYYDNGVKSVETDDKGFYYIMLNGAKQKALLTSKMEDRYGFSKYYVNKFSYQDGDPMLNSPVILRLAEVVLNRAEAYAKKGDAASLQKALDDVNTIRKRAGLSGKELFATDNMRGYDSVLEIVMDERRLELAFEGHRAFDVYRNNMPLDRRFPGVHPGVIMQPNHPRVIYYIPEIETSTSGIPQNE
jgi:hypothetical protein